MGDWANEWMNEWMNEWIEKNVSLCFILLLKKTYIYMELLPFLMKYLLPPCYTIKSIIVEDIRLIGAITMDQMPNKDFFSKKKPKWQTNRFYKRLLLFWSQFGAFRVSWHDPRWNLFLSKFFYINLQSIQLKKILFLSK